METAYSYDKLGNLSQILSGESVKNQYLYGALNRMEQATNQTGEIARYTYNGLGYRVGKELGSQAGMPGTTSQPFSKEAVEKELNPLEQLHSSQFHPTNHIDYTIDLTRQYHNLLQKTENQDSTQTYLWDGNVVGMLDNGKKEPAASSYYLQDDLGSPIRLLYENGEVQESYGYGEFGEDLYTSQRQSQPFGYTGYQRDEMAGTHFAQAREYRAEIGRFVSQDLFKGRLDIPITINEYIYCRNAPIKFVDLNGMDPVTKEEGDEAHRLLQIELSAIPGVEIEYSIKNSSVNGNTGYADIVYKTENIVEIYEIKPGSYTPGK